MKKVVKQQPFMPMFVADFFSSTVEWDGEEEGLYALLLMRQWSLGHLPIEVTKLARLVRYDNRNFERWWPVVSTKFTQVDVPGIGPRLVNSRLEEHRAKAVLISEKRAKVGKLGAEAKQQNSGNCHTDEVAIASDESGNCQDFATSKSLPSNPIQSNPIQESSGKSPQALTPVAQVAPASLFPAERIEHPAIERVFAHWRQVHDHPRAQLDDKRRKLIRTQLKTYSEADLCQAISGYLNSPHHMGQNDSGTVYDGLELLLRDAKRIDAGIKFFEHPPRTDLSAGTRRAISQTEDWEPPAEARRAG